MVTRLYGTLAHDPVFFFDPTPNKANALKIKNEKFERIPHRPDMQQQPMIHCRAITVEWIIVKSALSSKCFDFVWFDNFSMRILMICDWNYKWLNRKKTRDGSGFGFTSRQCSRRSHWGWWWWWECHWLKERIKATKRTRWERWIEKEVNWMKKFAERRIHSIE